MIRKRKPDLLLALVLFAGFGVVATQIAQGFLAADDKVEIQHYAAAERLR